MSLFKTLKTLVRTPNPHSRFPPSHRSLPAVPLSPLPPPTSPAVPFSLSRGRPLFLLSPPWKLPQCANPVYFGRRVVKLRGGLIEVRSLPLGLDFSSMAEGQRNDRGLVSEKKKTPALEADSTGINEKFLNLPNLVSISRMVSGPVIGWMIMNEWKMGINSVFGSYLDPLADKVLIGCVALSMVKMDLLNSGLVGLVIFRDVGLVGGAVYKRASMMNWQWNNWSEFFNLDGQHREKVEPLFISKVNTVFQLLLVGLALLQPDFGTEETEQYLTYLSWLVAATTVTSTVGYGIQYFRNRPIIR